MWLLLQWCSSVFMQCVLLLIDCLVDSGLVMLNLVVVLGISCIMFCVFLGDIVLVLKLFLVCVIVCSYVLFILVVLVVVLNCLVCWFNCGVLILFSFLCVGLFGGVVMVNFRNICELGRLWVEQICVLFCLCLYRVLLKIFMFFYRLGVCIVLLLICCGVYVDFGLGVVVRFIVLFCMQ